jgi:hypothetical protein
MNPESVIKLQAMPGITAVRLWDLPYRTLNAQLSLDENSRKQAIGEFLLYASKPWLYKARVLHFQGKFDFEMIEQLYGQEMAEKYDRQTSRYYYRMSRPADHEIMEVRTSQERLLLVIGKVNSSYWLGLLAMDDGDDKVAIDFLKERTLGAIPNGPWTPGAHYNLGRVEELVGNQAAAIEQYEQTSKMPQGYGNRLRARWLKEGVGVPGNTEPAPEASKETDTEKTPSSGEPEESPAAKESPGAKPEAVSKEAKTDSSGADTPDLQKKPDASE